MSDIIPKNEYFKLTTRSMLSDAEKQKIAAAVERALQYLVSMTRAQKLTHTTEQRGDIFIEKIRLFYSRQKYLNRCLHLVKGSTQPRYLYRRARREAIARESRRIAAETGASFEEVEEMFLEFMSRFIVGR